MVIASSAWTILAIGNWLDLLRAIKKNKNSIGFTHRIKCARGFGWFSKDTTHSQLKSYFPCRGVTEAAEWTFEGCFPIFRFSLTRKLCVNVLSLDLYNY